MVERMATKKYTVTLPEELAEAIRAEVGSGNFSRYVTRAIEGQRERDRLHEAVRWWESEYGEVTEAELAEVEAEHRDLERRHEERAVDRSDDPGQGTPEPAGTAGRPGTAEHSSAAGHSGGSPCDEERVAA